MKDHIKKLSPDMLLEVSGGMEEDTKGSWARGLGPINSESGEQEKKIIKRADDSEVEKVDKNSEED